MRTAALIVAVLGLNSCLEKFPGDAFSYEQSMKTFSDAEQTLTGIYSSYMSSALYSGNLALLPDIQADLVLAVQGNSNIYGSIWQWDIRPTSSEITSVYAALYTVIARCNFYLDKVEALRESLVDDAEIESLDYRTGEVYCARANAYAELIKCFCEAYSDQTKDAEQSGVAIDSTFFGKKPQVRSTLRESYEFVIRDLEKAEELLDEDYDYYTNPYVTKAAAQALRARIALYMNDSAKAIEYSTKVIENEAFDLASSSVYQTGQDPVTRATRTFTYVDYMWTHDLSFEIIWQVGFLPTYYGGALGQVFLNFNNDFRFFYPDYMPASWAVQLYATSDARRAAYFRTEVTGYPGNPQITLLSKYLGNHADFIPNKIWHVTQPKPLRLAEQYLIRAEAYCMKGEFGKANTDIQKLRLSRAGSAASVSESNWVDVISNERVKELYMEGFRLNDLKRWGRGFERQAQANAQKEGSTLKIEKGDHRFVWPIPQHEIEAPGSKIKQNRGY